MQIRLDRSNSEHARTLRSSVFRVLLRGKQYSILFSLYYLSSKGGEQTGYACPRSPRRVVFNIVSGTPLMLRIDTYQRTPLIALKTVLSYMCI